MLSTGSPKRESAVNPIHEARLNLFLTENLSQGPAWMLGQQRSIFMNVEWVQVKNASRCITLSADLGGDAHLR
jgi:hypothetical protein